MAVNPITTFENGKRAGIEIGRQQARTEVLSFLQSEYMNRDLEVGSPKALAILELTRAISDAITVKPSEAAKFLAQ